MTAQGSDSAGALEELLPPLLVLETAEDDGQHRADRSPHCGRRRSGHPAHEYFASRYTEIYGGLADVLRSAAAAGYVAADIDPERAAIRLNAMVDGLQLQWLNDQRIDVSSHVREYIYELLTPSGRAAFAAAGAPVDALPSA